MSMQSIAKHTDAFSLHAKNHIQDFAGIPEDCTEAAPSHEAELIPKPSVFHFGVVDFDVSVWPNDIPRNHVLSAFLWCEQHLPGATRELLIDAAMAYGMRKAAFLRWLVHHGFTEQDAQSRYLSYYPKHFELGGTVDRNSPSPQILWELARTCEWGDSCTADKKLVDPGLKQPITQNRRFKFFNELESDLNRPWLVREIIPATGVVMIYGPSGSGKSFLVLDLIFALAMGQSWFGREIKAPVSVLYIGLEGQAGIYYRYVALCNRRGTPSERLHCLVDEAVDLRSTPGCTQLAEDIIREVGRGAVVVIDTLSRAIPGADENSSSEVSLIMANCTMISQRINGVIVLVHHTGKDASKGPRGGTGFPAAVEASIEVTRTGDVRGWKLPKVRDGEDGKYQRFRLDTVPAGSDADGNSITSCVVQPLSDGKLDAVVSQHSMRRLKATYDRLNAGENGLKADDLLTAAEAMHPGYRKANAKRDLAQHLGILVRELRADRIICLP